MQSYCQIPYSCFCQCRRNPMTITAKWFTYPLFIKNWQLRLIIYVSSEQLIVLASYDCFLINSVWIITDSFVSLYGLFRSFIQNFVYHKWFSTKTSSWRIGHPCFPLSWWFLSPVYLYLSSLTKSNQDISWEIASTSECKHKLRLAIVSSEGLAKSYGWSNGWTSIHY